MVTIYLLASGLAVGDILFIDRKPNWPNVKFKDSFLSTKNYIDPQRPTLHCGESGAKCAGARPTLYGRVKRARIENADGTALARDRCLKDDARPRTDRLDGRENSPLKNCFESETEDVSSRSRKQNRRRIGGFVEIL